MDRVSTNQYSVHVGRVAIGKGLIMDGRAHFELGRIAGISLAVAGVLTELAGFLHPQGGDVEFHTAIASMLTDSRWPVAHWFALVAALLLACTVWVLTDAGWTGDSFVARAGSRLTIIATTFMAVQFAVELAARSEASAVAASQAEPLTELTRSLQAVGWPAWSLGFILLMLGVPRAAPRIIAVLGIIGALATGAAGILTMGFEITAVGFLFPIGGLLYLWVIWAGVRLARGRGVATVGWQPVSDSSLAEPIIGGTANA